MKKSLLSLLIFALVFTMAAPAFAATDAAVKLSDISNSYAKEEIEALVEAGIIGGYADGTFKPANSITRAEFAKILALVLDLEEDAAAASVFTDVPAWAKGYVGALVNAELTQGVTATTYGSNQNISREQLATFFVRAWDLEEAAEEVDLTPKFNDADKVAPYAKANVALAGEIEFIKGLPNGNFDPKGNAQRQAVARLAYEFYANSEEYLAAAEDVINAAKPTLEVTDVKATNLKEVFVEFNQAVAEGTIADANFALKDKDGDSVKVTATLNENGTTVVLTVKDEDDKSVALENQAKYTLTVEKVKSTSDIAVEKTEKEFTAFDRELPEVEKVVVTGPKSFDIIFSEPIKDNDGTAVEVKEENTTIGANQNFEGFGTRTVSVDLYSDMVDGKTYDVTIKNFVDYADYKNVVTVYELAYEKDETAPVAEVIKAEQEYLIVKFNKPVTGLTKEHFYHSFSAWTAQGIYKDAAMEKEVLTSDKVSTVYVSFYDGTNDDTKKASRPLPEGKVTFVAKNKVGSNEVKDNWGNKFEEAVFELTIGADKVTPEVTGITVRSESTLRVTFNKNVNFNASNVEVLNTDGSKIDGVHPVVSTATKDTVFDIALGKALSGKTVLVKITDVEDRSLAGNKLSTYSETITITDKTAPEVQSVLRSAKFDERTLYVVYNEPVNATAATKANYSLVSTVDGKTKLTAFSGNASYYNDNRVIKLVFTESQWKDLYVDGTSDYTLGNKFHSLHVANVEDVSGNKLTGQTVALKNGSEDIKKITDGTLAPQVKDAEATATDKLVLTFDQYLPTVQMGAFKVNGKDPAAMTVGKDSEGNTVVTLTAAKNFEFSHYADGDYSILPSDKSGERLANTFGQSPAKVENEDDITDKIAPTVKEVFVNKEGTVIEIEFHKNLARSTFSETKNDFYVSGGTLDTVVLKGTGDTNVVVLSGEKFSKNTTVHYDGKNITDSKGNKLASFNYRKALTEGSVKEPEQPNPVDTAKAALKAVIDSALGKYNDQNIQEGTEVGNRVVGSRQILKTAIDAANSEYTFANNEADVNAAKKALEDAVEKFDAAIVAEIDTLAVAGQPLKAGDTAVITGVNPDTAAGETLNVTSGNTDAVTVDAATGLDITAVAEGTAIIKVEVKNAAGSVIKTGTVTVEVEA